MVRDKNILLITGCIAGFVLIVAISGCHKSQIPQSPKQANQEKVVQTNNEPNKLPTVAESSDEDLEQIEKMKKDPKLVVKLRTHSGLLPFYSLAQNFDQTALPKFYEVLKDSSYTGDEQQNAIIFISQISKRGNLEAIDALKNYALRKVDWTSRTRMDGLHIVMAKCTALDWLGYVGGEKIEAFLKNAMTEEGGKELAKQWYADMPVLALSRESVMKNLRGFAARGLGYSDNPEVHEFLRSEYEREKKVCIENGEISDYYFNQVTEAITRIDIIKDIGLEAHKALWDAEGSYSYTYRKYIRKYLLFEAVEPVKKNF